MGSYNDLESELIKVLDKKIKYYSCIKELNIDKNRLYFLQTKQYDREILDKYNLLKVDVLKVRYPGSKTSSSIEFINEINPKYFIISVGKNNRYGHPNKEVLDNLNKSKVYRTDQDGSIMFKIKITN